MGIDHTESECDIPAIRYEGYSLQEKHAWVRDGSGPDAAEDIRAALSILADAMAESDLLLRRALQPLGIDWQGAAATSVGAACALVADWSLACGDSAREGGVGVAVAGAGFAHVRVRVEAPGPGRADTRLDVFAGPFGGQADLTQEAEAERARDDAANRAFYAYEDAVRDAVRSLPVLAAPPGVAVAAVTTRPTCPERSGVPRTTVQAAARTQGSTATRHESGAPIPTEKPPGADPTATPLAGTSPQPAPVGPQAAGVAIPGQPAPDRVASASPPGQSIGVAVAQAVPPPPDGPRSRTGPWTAGGAGDADRPATAGDRGGAMSGTGSRAGRADLPGGGTINRAAPVGPEASAVRRSIESAGDPGFAAAGLPVGLGMSGGTAAAPRPVGGPGPSSGGPSAGPSPRTALGAARTPAPAPDRFDMPGARTASPAVDEPDRAADPLGFEAAAPYTVDTVDGASSIAPAVLGTDPAEEPR
ncbi:hypothetical protein FHR81_002940 [Actinoalloteichus hoggarensis]|uniref:Uncharacterized protein n=1 Tax=Actinoalloteichus hoggarensis TaxID=1470176 RepID=A0A221VZ63_9PSEU|nr:hypothetical protein [Actinoalloteichus hoggarensis]ASO18531.1 hypothetical protein AHOG_04375 [Actinoalloteichus hoggarensis]MBB5921900.1 hypothetical protein [Actinoalloteichus hoggarensis]